MNQRGCKAVLLALVVLLMATVRVSSGGRSPQEQSPPVVAPIDPLPESDCRNPDQTPRIAVFRASGFPTADAVEIPEKTLEEALRGLPVQFLASVEEVRSRLKARFFDLLVLPYGSAFPLDAWPAIRSFVNRGGGLLVLGGAPFHQPVRWLATKSDSGNGEMVGHWVLGRRQPAFARELLIGPAEEIDTGSIPPGWGGLKTETVNVSQWTGGGIKNPDRVYELTVRFATLKDFSQEGGSAGPRDAVLRPLIHLVDDRGVARLCPLLEIDRLNGREAGARWILATCRAGFTASFIRRCVERALENAAAIDIFPLPACLDPGETPRLRIVVRRPLPRAAEPIPPQAQIEIHDRAGRKIFSEAVPLTGTAELRLAEMSIKTTRPLLPGLYRVEASLPDAPWHPQSASSGFWVRDDKLLRSGPTLSVSRDWLRKDGQVFPVIGTTYMAADVHRKFLFEPNPLRWEEDFSQMARLGINFVRTGLWTGWSRVMLDPGAVDEGMLRALDAFVMTAARHNIVVCFTFFAFLPPDFGGVNPYLDPRCLAGQKSLLATVARRYRNCGWIHYDLINEPSYAPLEALWQSRPFYDEFEQAAWLEWLRQRGEGDQAAWRDLWQDPAADLFGLPKKEEFTYSPNRENRRWRKVRDFILFSQDVFSSWAATLRDTLRAAAGSVLVTVGQDEGGTGVRPGQQFHDQVVDYTAVHTWWNNDDLLWDGVMTKVPEKPNLVQETGLMRLETIDGTPWRSPEAASLLLQRKFALAFAGRGAGAVEWVWNVNPYQPQDNEAVIGLIRADGTAKPELDVLAEFASFFRQATPLLDDFENDPVVLIIPHSRIFSRRPLAVDGIKRIIRVLADRFGVVPAAVSELRLSPGRLKGARLVLLPTAEMIDGKAAAVLLQAAQAGTKILVTGCIQGDPYGRLTDSLRLMGIVDTGRPVMRRESTRWTEGGYATFENDASEFLLCSLAPPLSDFSGNIWHEPLPLELAREEEPLAGLLQTALNNAGVECQPPAAAPGVRILKTPVWALIILVNETSTTARRQLTVDGHHMDVTVPAAGVKLLLCERSSGRVRIALPAVDLPAASD